MLELRSLAKTFTKPVGVAGHIANLFGAKVRKIEVQRCCRRRSLRRQG